MKLFEALTLISVNLAPTTIERFCVSADGQPWLGPLRAVSSNWKAIIDSLVDEGKILRERQEKPNYEKEEVSRLSG